MQSEVFSPLDITELAAVLPQLKSDSVIASGCTDLSIRFLNAPMPSQLVNLCSVSELKQIFVDGEYLRIGAAVTITELEGYEMPNSLVALKQAASEVGSKQIRNAATIGGNVMNASPAGDVLLCLFLFEAIAEIMNSNGTIYERRIDEVVIGSGKTSLDYNEVLTAIKIPLVCMDNLYSAFLKLGFRKKVTIARINMAVSLSFSNGKVENIRLYMGAVAPVPIRVRKAEKILEENEWNEQTYDELSSYLSEMIERTVPIEYDRDYKMYAIKGVVYDVLSKFPKPN
jgi:carbon-monoxide dehydrogenase medium subunit